MIINEHVVHDHYLIITVIVVIWSFFCGLAYLLCSVPALILSIMVRQLCVFYTDSCWLICSRLYDEAVGQYS